VDIQLCIFHIPENSLFCALVLSTSLPQHVLIEVINILQIPIVQREIKQRTGYLEINYHLVRSVLCALVESGVLVSK